MGTSALNLFVIALAFPPRDDSEALTRAGLVLLGGLWAMLVSLVLWPLSPYRPVRRAVARRRRRALVLAPELPTCLRFPYIIANALHPFRRTHGD